MYVYLIDTSRPYCEENPCQNSGVCTEAGLSFTCTCVAGYIGSQCELEGTVCLVTEDLCHK